MKTNNNYNWKHTETNMNKIMVNIRMNSTYVVKCRLKVGRIILFCDSSF